MRKDKIESEDVKVWDLMRQRKRPIRLKSFDEDRNTFSDVKNEIKAIIKDDFQGLGQNSERDSLSPEERKFYDVALGNMDWNKFEKRYKELPNYQQLEAELTPLAAKMQKCFKVYNVNEARDILQSGKRMGLSPGTMEGGLYQNNLKTKKKFIHDTIHGATVEEGIRSILSERPWRKAIEAAPSGRTVNYDSYIRLHTNTRAGKTAAEQTDNLAKCLAAEALRSAKRPFNTRTIHAMAAHMKRLYALDALKEKNPALLRKFLNSRDSVRKAGVQLRNAVYGVKPEKRQWYLNDMDRLYQNMVEPGRNSSKEYEKLYESVRNAADLKYNLGAMDPERQEEALLNANIAVMEAVDKYTAGKEKLRSSESGKARFDNALDAAAILTKYAPGVKLRTDGLIETINQKRNHGNREAEDYIDPERFAEAYGAANAESRKEQRLNPGGATKDQGLQDLVSPTVGNAPIL